MKLPEIVVDDFELSACPALSTGSPGAHPDIGPGAGQARDDFLDALARGADRTAEQHEPTASEQRAGADVMQSVQAARADLNLAHCIDFADRPAPVDPLLALKRTG